MATQIFVNLPVKELDKTKDFFSKLGFKFSPQFTDANAACMIISDDIFAMLLVDKFFKTFTKKQISDTANSTEVILAISVQSKDKVDEMMASATKAGGKSPGLRRIMDGCTDAASRILTGISGKYFTWILTAHLKREKSIQVPEQMG